MNDYKYEPPDEPMVVITGAELDAMQEQAAVIEAGLQEAVQLERERDEWKARAEAAKAARATVPVKAIATATRAATAVYGLSETRKDVQAINRWLLEREQEKIQKARQAVQP